MAVQRQIYLNGSYVPEAQALLPVFDRGFLFADGIYEVCAVIDRRLVDVDLHMKRLVRSVGEIGIALPVASAEVVEIMKELVRRNRLVEGVVYMQVTRGSAERDFHYADDLKPNFVAFTQDRKIVTPKLSTGISVDLQPDIRWQRRDIKSVMLLAQVLAKHEASKKGFNDVWMVEDGFITEGASSSAFIVTKDGRIVSRANSQAILPGCTRLAVLRLAEETGLLLDERPFTVEQAQDASEAFLTSASSTVTPVVRIGECVIGDGKPGPLTRRLQAIYLDQAMKGEPLFALDDAVSLGASA